MKTTLIAAASLVAITLPASAATVSVRTGSANAFESLIVDSNGDRVSNGTGFVAVGDFDGNEDSLTSENVASLFDQFGTDSITFGASSQDGFVQGDIDVGPTIAGIGDAGQQIFVVFGNGSDLASSTEFAVFETSAVVPTDPATPPAAVVTAVIDASQTANVLVGDATTASIGTNSFPAIQLAPAVPEPSSALLGLVGLAGFAARRRR